MSNNEKKYFVVWRVELDAKDPEEAARRAAHVQEIMAKNSEAAYTYVFEVSEKDQDSCPYSDIIKLKHRKRVPTSTKFTPINFNFQRPWAMPLDVK